MRLDTQEYSVVHLCEIQELANLSTVAEIRIIISPGKLLNELTEKAQKKVREIEMSYSVI